MGALLGNGLIGSGGVLKDRFRNIWPRQASVGAAFAWDLSKAAPSTFNFTRSSKAWEFDQTGTLVEYAVNAFRKDCYDPSTLTWLGARLEKPRTNAIRNSSAAGAIVGTPGTLPTNWGLTGSAGLALNVIGTGIEAGIPYVDLQLVGTPAGSSAGIRSESVSQMAAVDGQLWSTSAYLRMVGGAITNLATIQMNMQTRDSGGVFLGDVGSSSDFKSAITAANIAVNRKTFTGTLSGGTIAFINTQIFFGLNSGQAINITLRIGCPQTELGGSPSSPILTTGSSITRATELAYISPCPWINSSEGTLYAKANLGLAGGDATDNQYLAEIMNTTADRVILRALSSVTATIIVGGSTTYNPGPGTKAANLALKAAVGYKTGNNYFACNSPPATFDGPAAGAVPPGMTTLYLGGDSTTSELNGYLQEVKYYSYELPVALIKGLVT